MAKQTRIPNKANVRGVRSGAGTEAKILLNNHLAEAVPGFTNSGP